MGDAIELPTAAAAEIERHAHDVDRDGRFPAEALKAIRAAGLYGLAVPTTHGGLGGTPADAARVVAQVAGGCSSAGMVFAMHVAATATLAAGTPADDDGPKAAALRAAGRGEQLTTLAYSERGTRSHFWAQASRAQPAGDGAVVVDADKSWVTSARHADVYVLSVGAAGSDVPTDSDLYLVDRSMAGVEPLDGFDGLGLRGNDSGPVRIRGLRLGEERRLGAASSGLGQMLGATLPWFSIASAASCVGLARTALRLATEHATGATFDHLAGTALRDLPTIRQRLAGAQVRLMETEALLTSAASLIAAGSPTAPLSVLAVKASAAEMAIAVTDEAMRVGGGAAFSRHLPIERLFRDARAAAVMAPTTDVLRDFIGRAITGLELL